MNELNEQEGIIGQATVSDCTRSQYESIETIFVAVAMVAIGFLWIKGLGEWAYEAVGLGGWLTPEVLGGSEGRLVGICAVVLRLTLPLLLTGLVVIGGLVVIMTFIAVVARVSMRR